MSNEIVYRPAGTGQAYWVMGDLITFLVTGAESGQSYFTLEVIVAPGNGPPPHVHHLEEEQFYVLEGELTFSVGGQTHHVSRGDFVHIPRDTVHAFRNGGAPARMLATFAPAGIEGFFQAAGEPVTDRSAPPTPVTAETIARLVAAEAGGWQGHHATLPTPANREDD